MSLRIVLGGDAQQAADRAVPRLVAARVASRLTAQDPGLYDAGAPAAAGERLRWTEAVAASRPLVGQVARLPVGVVTPSQAFNRDALLLTYQQVGALTTRYGADVAA